MTDGNSPKTKGDLIQRMKAIKAERKRLSAQDSILGKEYAELELQLIAALDDDGTESTKAQGTSATINETIVADVQDWDQFYQYIKDNEAFYLLQRRVNNKPYQEILNGGDTVPGVQKFVKRSISLRNN